MDCNIGQRAPVSSGWRFRGMPGKAVLADAAARDFDWRREPAVTGHFRIRQAGKPVPVHASAAVAGDVGVLFAAGDGVLRFFDLCLERIFWEQNFYADIYAGLVVDGARMTVIVATTGGRVTAFDLKGRPVWDVELGCPVFATPAIAETADLLVVAAFGHRAFGLSLANGELRFETALPPPWYTAVAGLAGTRSPYASPATTDDGETAVCAGAHVLRLRPDGTIRWSCDVGADIKASPILSPDFSWLAVACVDGSVHMLDGDGTTLWRRFLGAKITASGAATAGGVLAGTSDSAVHCLDPATGGELWRSPFGAPFDHTAATLTPAGDVLATAASGNMVCLDATDGRFLWETSQVLGLADHDPQMHVTPVATQRGALFCASWHGDLYRFDAAEAP
jgi:outer membrane protein assembly factor BamB